MARDRILRSNGSQCTKITRFIAGVFALGALASGCTKQQAAPPPRPAVPVVVGTVTQKAMPVEVVAVGNVEAYSSVAIKAQVAGQLLEVHFTEGDFVHKGQKL